MKRLLLLVALCLSGPLRAEPVGEYDLKAAYLFNLARYTDWPEMNRANFNFCILGDEELGRAMLRYDERRIREMRVVIARISSITPIRQCQLLYVGGRELASLGKIHSMLGELPVLTVADFPATPQVGIAIALEENRLVFDLNMEHWNKAGLKPQLTLVRLARAVRK